MGAGRLTPKHDFWPSGPKSPERMTTIPGAAARLRGSFEEALAQASNPDDFALRARGIASSSDSRWDDFDAEDGAKAEDPIKVERF